LQERGCPLPGFGVGTSGLGRRKQLIRRLFQTPIRREVPNEFSGQFVYVAALKIVDLFTPKAENTGSADERDLDALAVEDISVHGSRSIEAFLEVVPIDRRVLQAAPC
jgi:hypothetical protein